MMAERKLGMDETEYMEHAYPDDRPCLSQSMAAILRRCPAEAFARHPLLGNDPLHMREDRRTPSTTLGVGVERYLLSGGHGVVHVPHDSFRTSAARDLRDEALENGQLPLTDALHDKVVKVATAASVKLTAGTRERPPIHLNGDSQVVYIWPHETHYGVIWCRARLDHVIVNDGQILIYDLKTTRNAAHDKFARSVVDYGYHIQAAGYEDGVRAFHGDITLRRPLVVEYYLILVEPSSANVNVSVRSFSPEMSLIGASKWSESCELWGKCLAENSWPEYLETEQNGPGWYLGQYGDLLR